MPGRASNNRRIAKCADFCFRYTKDNAGTDKACNMFQYRPHWATPGVGWHDYALGIKCIGKEKCDVNGCSSRRKRSAGPKKKCESHANGCQKKVNELLYENNPKWYPNGQRSLFESTRKHFSSCAMYQFENLGDKVSECDKVAWYDACIQGILI